MAERCALVVAPHVLADRSGNLVVDHQARLMVELPTAEQGMERPPSQSVTQRPLIMMTMQWCWGPFRWHWLRCWR